MFKKRFNAGLCLLLTLVLGLLSDEIAAAKKGGKNPPPPPTPPPVVYDVIPIGRFDMEPVNDWGGTNVSVWCMNSSGTVIGYADDPDGVDHPFISYAGGLMEDLNMLLSDERGDWTIRPLIRSVNEVGAITGNARKDGLSRAFRYDPNAPEYFRFSIFPDPDVTPETIGFTKGLNINNQGDVLVLLYIDDESPTHYYLWSADGSVAKVGENISSWSVDLNDNRVVVGATTDPSEFLAWNFSGGLRFTPTEDGYEREFFPTLQPEAINNFGMITGSTLVNNRTYAFRLHPEDDFVEVLQDGSRSLEGAGACINDSGDVGVSDGRIYFDGLGLFALQNLVDPEDQYLLSDNVGAIWIRAIGERLPNENGFPSILVQIPRVVGKGKNTSTTQESLLMIPRLDP